MEKGFRRPFPLVVFILLGLSPGLAQERCDLPVEEMDRLYLRYQDDSLRALTSQWLPRLENQPDGFCYYQVMYYHVQSFTYNNLDTAILLSKALKPSANPNKEVLRLGLEQTFANRLRDYPRRIQALKSGLAASLEIPDSNYSQRWAYVFRRQLTQTYTRLAYYDSALMYGYTLLETNNPKHSIDGSNTVGQLLVELGRWKEAISQWRRAIRLIEEIPSLHQSATRTVSQNYYNVGGAYIETENSDSALYFLNKSLLVARTLGDELFVARKLANVALLHLKQSEYDLAWQQLLEARRIELQYQGEQYQSRLHTILYNLVDAAHQLKRNEEALQFAKESLIHAEQTGQDKLRAESYHLLYRAYDSLGMESDAFASFLEYHNLNQDLLTQERLEIVEELRAQHETEKKEQAITSLTQENAIQDLQLKQQRLGLLGGGIVTLLVISLGWVILRQRNLKAQQIQWNLERNLLRTQMNPHFIFNSLASIQSFVLRKDNKKAVLYLAKFGELTRDILEASRQDFVPLEQEIRMVSNYVALEQARFGKTLNLEIDIGDLDAENITIPPMLIQPFLENSIQHGSATRDQGDIHLKISEKDNKLKVIVEDNGTGLAEGAMNSNKSLAIKITRERLQHIHQGGGKVLLQVTNRKDPEGHILGVRVQFELPLRYAF